MTYNNHKLIFLFIIAGFYSQIKVYCQSAVNSVDSFSKYERASLTYCLLDVPDEKYHFNTENAFKKIKVNEKFNNHIIPSQMVLPCPYNRFYDGQDRGLLVKEKLEQSGVAHAVIAKWFSQKPDGTFNMSLIADRGIYNASDADIAEARAGKRGVHALEDAGEPLINKSFVIAYDFVNVETWNEHYDNQDAKLLALAIATNTRPTRVPRIYQGYRGEVFAYVYQVDWNDSLSALFYQKAWNDPNYFKNMTFPLKFVAQVVVPRADGSELRGDDTYSPEQLMEHYTQDGVEKSLIEIARALEDFRVRIALFSSKPLTAKIGTKEDVRLDERFYVYEMVQMKDKKLVPHLRGVVRATKFITDNTGNATGQTKPTRFYQEFGKKLYAGMLLEQRYDAGINLVAGYGQRSLQGPMFRLEYNLAPLLNISLFRIFLEGQYGFGNVKLGNGTQSLYVTSYYLAIGFSKEFCFSRNVHLEPYGAFLFDSTFLSDSKYKSALNSYNVKSGVTHFGLIGGLRLPINIRHNLQIVPSVGVSTIIFSSNNSLFGSQLPEALPPDFITGQKIDKTDNNWRNNPHGNLNQHIVKWDVMLRYKF